MALARQQCRLSATGLASISLPPRQTIRSPAYRTSAGTERCSGGCVVVDSRRSGNHT
jgi:hypothetical protein